MEESENQAVRGGGCDVGAPRAGPRVLSVEPVRIFSSEDQVGLPEEHRPLRAVLRVHTPDEAILLQPGDGLTNLAGLTHQIENVGTEDAELSLSYSSGDRGSTSPSDGRLEQNCFGRVFLPPVLAIPRRRHLPGLEPHWLCRA